MPFQVRWGVLLAYAKAVGLKFSVLIVLLYGSYQGFAVWANIWLTRWTSNPDLQSLDKLPADSKERRDKNDYYLGIYGALGVAQGRKMEILVDKIFSRTVIIALQEALFLTLSSPSFLTLVLLNLDIPCLCKQCRSRSVGF